MTERKFNVPLIIISILALALGLFGFSAESILLGVISIIFSVKMREKCLIKIPIAISIVAIAGSGLFLSFLIWQEVKGIGSTDYWLMRLIFGKMR